MSARQSPEASPLVAGVLRAGAYGAFALLALGVLLDYFGLQPEGASLMRAGVLVLLATPPVRVLMVAVVFWRGDERKYALVSLAVLAIIAGSWILSAL